ncbi:hypothetical protein ACFWIQ_06065 [Kitasatospora sp. NPDC127059]|uniref:hypothetical protein n=1 Tax=unclassified Kitasatospora TaxID=2633591 RepID=UPI0036579B48
MRCSNAWQTHRTAPHRTVPAGAGAGFASPDEPAAAIDTFVPACDEHDAESYHSTYDGSPLEAA